jgi:hypothetical protein
MKLKGPEIISDLNTKLQFESGRHLYAVLGTYMQLDKFETLDLSHAKMYHDRLFPKPINLNKLILEYIEDEDLKNIIRNEAKHPTSVQNKLNQALKSTLQKEFIEKHFIILKQFELVFAYQLDLSIFRTQAINANHILLLLPAARIGNHITIFHEASERFRIPLQNELIAENHLWELYDDQNR